MEPTIIDFEPEFEPIPETLTPQQSEQLDRIKGCLLGGAVGDALGAPTEFLSSEEIKDRFGPGGLSDLVPAYGRIGAITDDTQMTLFTAEGLIRAYTRWSERGICSVENVVYYSYMRWLHTQRVQLPPEHDDVVRPSYLSDSWLLELPDMNHRRAPGNSCLAALRSGQMGTVEEPINNSKGCGGVMRVAPVGWIAVDPFDVGCRVAAITHGHPTGYLAAGAFAFIIDRLRNGADLNKAVKAAITGPLTGVSGADETIAALRSAVQLAETAGVDPTPEKVESLGGGWIAEEALAIAVYCSLVYGHDFERALLLAVNHSGDTDSTGAITGNILGTIHGTAPIPVHWLERLELRSGIEMIATDLFHATLGTDLSARYPGY
jgi:ADP-ribosylglycohydrolase